MGRVSGPRTVSSTSSEGHRPDGVAGASAALVEICGRCFKGASHFGLSRTKELRADPRAGCTGGGSILNLSDLSGSEAIGGSGSRGALSGEVGRVTEEEAASCALSGDVGEAKEEHEAWRGCSQLSVAWTANDAVDVSPAFERLILPLPRSPNLSRLREQVESGLGSCPAPLRPHICSMGLEVKWLGWSYRCLRSLCLGESSSASPIRLFSGLTAATVEERGEPSRCQVLGVQGDDRGTSFGDAAVRLRGL